MKVPKGKRVVFGSKQYRSCQEMPEDVARRVGLLKQQDTKPDKGTKKPDEPKGNS